MIELDKNDIILFLALNDAGYKMLLVRGVEKGDYLAVRRQWLLEYGDATEDCYLVKDLGPSHGLFAVCRMRF